MVRSAWIKESHDQSAMLCNPGIAKHRDISPTIAQILRVYQASITELKFGNPELAASARYGLSTTICSMYIFWSKVPGTSSREMVAGTDSSNVRYRLFCILLTFLLTASLASGHH